MPATGSLAEALRQFEKKFKDKSGLAWSQRGEKPKPGKYAFVERSYDAESDEEEEEEEAAGAAAKEKKGPPKSTLEPAVQELMQLIFNQEYFNNTMAHLNYDAKKLPLGKLSKATITRGFEVLKDLAAVIDDNNAAQAYGKSFAAVVEDLSNAYYSVIPHAFGRNRPPVIRDLDGLKREIELLESLSDMKDAQLIMKVDKIDSDIAQVDRQFKGLGMREMTPLDPAGAEFGNLETYLQESRGATHGHKYSVESIFRIEREGEYQRFDDSSFGKMGQNRRLLWHGSRSSNFGGILSQGLRIAPPEAPVSGYMFGKGIYLADMASKSANYCCSHMSNGVALLLLCEAELGSPMLELVHSSYNAGEDAKEKGMVATWGKGRTGPSKWKDAGCVNPALAGVMMVSLRILCGWLNPGCRVGIGSRANGQDAARHVGDARRYQRQGCQSVVQRVHLLRRLAGPHAVPAEGQDVSWSRETSGAWRTEWERDISELLVGDWLSGLGLAASDQALGIRLGSLLVLCSLLTNTGEYILDRPSVASGLTCQQVPISAASEQFQVAEKPLPVRPSLSAPPSSTPGQRLGMARRQAAAARPGCQRGPTTFFLPAPRPGSQADPTTHKQPWKPTDVRPGTSVRFQVVNIPSNAHDGSDDDGLQEHSDACSNPGARPARSSDKTQTAATASAASNSPRRPFPGESLLRRREVWSGIKLPDRRDVSHHSRTSSNLARRPRQSHPSHHRRPMTTTTAKSTTLLPDLGTYCTRLIHECEHLAAAPEADRDRKHMRDLSGAQGAVRRAARHLYQLRAPRLWLLVRRECRRRGCARRGQRDRHLGTTPPCAPGLPELPLSQGPV